MCSSGPRGTWRAQFLLSPVGEAQCVPKGGGQGGGRQELCEQARLGGEGGLPQGCWEGSPRWGGRRALEGWCVEQPGF